MLKQDHIIDTWAGMCSMPVEIDIAPDGSDIDGAPGSGDGEEGMDDDQTNLPVGTKWIVHPHAQKNVQWDLLVAVLIVYSTLSVPFRIRFDQTVGLLGSITYFVVDLAFLVDIINSFRTSVSTRMHGPYLGFLSPPYCLSILPLSYRLFSSLFLVCVCVCVCFG